MRWTPGLLLASCLAASLGLSGCTCDPETLDVAVTLAAAGEEVRTLPILVSERTHVAGVPVPLPDSHGSLDVRVNIPHANLTRILVHDLKAVLTVDNAAVPIRILDIEGGSRWREDGANDSWSGQVSDQQTLRLWWTVDREAAKSASALVLKEGAGYRMVVSWHWTYDDCSFTAKGSVLQGFNGFVRASANTKTFKAVDTPHVDVAQRSAGFRTNFTVQSGLSVTIDSATAVLVHHGPNGEVGAALFPTVGWTVDGLPASAVTPGKKLQTFSSSPSSAGSAYARSGTLVGGSSGAGSLYVLVETIRYTPSDGTIGSVADTFGFPRT